MLGYEALLVYAVGAGLALVVVCWSCSPTAELYIQMRCDLDGVQFEVPCERQKYIESKTCMIGNTIHVPALMLAYAGSLAAGWRFLQQPERQRYRLCVVLPWWIVGMTCVLILGHAIPSLAAVIVFTTLGCVIVSGVAAIV